jgi:hypothetical protein
VVVEEMVVALGKVVELEVVELEVVELGKVAYME